MDDPMTRRRLRASLLAVVLAFLAGLHVPTVVQQSSLEHYEFPQHPVRLDPIGWLLGQRVEAIYIPTIIRSIQRNVIPMSGGTSVASTITSVDPTKCSLHYLGMDVAGSSTDTSMAVRLAFTNATTITASATSASSTNISFEVVCFIPNYIKSIQRFTMSTSTTQTVTSVNTAKAMLNYLGMTISPGGNMNIGTLSYIKLTNATTVTSVYQGGNNAGTVGFELDEFF